MEVEVPSDGQDDAASPVRLPFSGTIIRKLVRQSLVSFPAGKPPVHRGVSQKSVVLLSLAVGLFLKHLTPEILARCPTNKVTRGRLLKALLASPRYHFVVTKMRPNEVFECFAETNELSSRIAVSNIERPLTYPIEFVAPHPPGQAHLPSEGDALSREVANVDAALKSLVLAHHAYRQAVPDFFKTQRPVKKGHSTV
jgi:hypothetical protein